MTSLCVTSGCNCWFVVDKLEVLHMTSGLNRQGLES